MSLALYKYFTGKERWHLLLEALEYRVSKKIPGDLRIKKAFVQHILSSGIRFKKLDNGILLEYDVNGKNINFFLRNESSDFSVFTQIILEKEYKSVVDIFNRLNLPVNRIVDAGANVGFSSLYLSAYYPEAHFICLEPHPGNFTALTRNINQNISKNKFSLIQKALWHQHVLLSGDNSFRDGKDWSFSVKEAGKSAGDIEGITMERLLEDHDLNEVDFLKIDIEGAEAQLFSDEEYLRSWIHKIKVMSIEIHDETNARFKIENIIQNLGFRLFNSGEITIAVNNNFVSLLNK